MEQNKTNIETKEELLYMMQFYGIKQVPVIETKPYKNLGVIYINKGGELSYKGGNWSYNEGYEHLAFDNAIRKFNEDIDKIKSWREIAKREFETDLAQKTEKGWKPEENGISAVKAWVYLSDIKDSGVEVVGGEYYNENTPYGMPMVDKGGDALRVRGTLDKLRKFLSYAVNHLRYCNGETYVYTDEEVVNWMKFFKEYDLYAAYDSFSEYYHNGIVD